MSMRWLAISCVSWAAACAQDPGPTTDAAVEDMMPAFTGLTIDFLADEALPAIVEGGVRVEDIYLNAAVIRAIGDATTQDEHLTTRHDHALHWDGDDEPGDLPFSAAPVGQYAYVELRIAGRSSGRRDAFDVRGKVRVDGDLTDFVIRAAAPPVIAYAPAELRLEAGRPLTIALELDVARLVQGVDWDALPEEDGELRLDEDTPEELARFGAALAGAFRIVPAAAPAAAGE